jgi:photosystem II stability/assembly factor-like uncharacterized protein
MRIAFRSIFALAILGAPVPAALADGLLSVSSPNGTDVWAVGNGGIILRSFDAGATWGSYPLDTVTLRAVSANGSGVMAAGNGGVFHRSTDAGGSWSTSVINGGVTVRALAFPDPSHGWACGDNGTIAVTTDGGASWNGQASGTSSALTALWFADSLTGYAAGNGGTLLKTVNGGGTWNVLPTGSSSDLTGISGRGLTVYLTGAREFCRKSTDGGAGWLPLNFHTDSRSDVGGVFAVAADTAFFIGGGGYIRSTRTGGTSYAWGQHGMHAPLSAIVMAGGTTGWAVSDRNNAVLRTTDGGATWLLPTGTTLTLAWTRKLVENSSIGNTFVIDPWNRDRIHVALGDSIYRSTDRGETWSFRAKIAGFGATHAFFISPKDSNLWIVANTGGGDAVKRTTNAGVSWTTTIQRGFTSYGMPLEMNPDRPDTVLFAPDGTGSGGSDANGILYRSTNFGLTWDTLASTNFRSPCDIVIVPDSNALVYVGDGITSSGRGKMWRSDDEGKSWTLIDSVSGSEIPTISIGRMHHGEAFNTAWGSGGFRKTSDFGTTWTQVASTGSAWGTDVAKDDPNVVMFGVYGGGISYLSTDGGASFPAALQAGLTGSNYAILAYDRATILAQQSGGVYKLGFTYAVPVSNIQTVNLTSPNGGENWQYNSVHSITWTSGNLSNVRLEYQTSAGGPWQGIVGSTPAAAGAFPWTIPASASTQMRVRISDVADSNPVDSSTGVFTVSVASIAASPGSLTFGATAVGSTAVDTLRITNSGTAPLVVSSASTGSAAFAAGRTSFTIPPGGSDTLSVAFHPLAGGPATDTLAIGNSSPGGVLHIPLAGSGLITVPAPAAPENGEQYVALPAAFTWSATPGATAYHLQVGADSLFGAPLVDDSSFTTTAGQAGGLSAGAGYYWRVRALFPGNASAWSAPWHFSTAGPVTRTMHVAEGWNLLSLPVAVGDGRVPQLFPDAASGAFAYEDETGYVARDTLRLLEGYWLKFPAADSIGITGIEEGRDTVAVGAGWNLIGAVSGPVDTTLVIQMPPGLIVSAYYGYDAGYAAADSLRPGRAYWVKSAAAGQLILAPLAPPASPASRAVAARNRKGAGR